MSKKNIRLLALGFFMSGLLLVSLQALPFNGDKSNNEHTAEALESEVHFLEEKLVALELENEELIATLESVEVVSAEEEATTEGGENEEDNEESNDEDKEETETESDASQTEEETEEPVDAEEEEAEETVKTYTVVVKEGQPSSVIANQLEEFGLIEDRHAFNSYLEESDYYKRVRAGSYKVTSDMNRDELVQAVIN